MSYLTTMSSISDFYRDWTFERISGITSYPQPFKKYTPLQRGNMKLEKNILIWNLMAVSTCGGRHCKGCYVDRGYRYSSVREKHVYNTWMTMYERDNLKEMIINQIVRSRGIDYVRIHGSGDFYSLDYVQFWCEISAEVRELRPDIQLYTYTKEDYVDELEMAGIVVNRSLVKGLGMNYGPIDKMIRFIGKQVGHEYSSVMEFMDEQQDIFNRGKFPIFTLCPATVKEGGIKKKTKCGKTCTACMTNSTWSLFVEH